MSNYISDKKWNKIINETYDELYKNSHLFVSEEEIDKTLAKCTGDIEAYKKTILKPGVTFEELVESSKKCNMHYNGDERYFFPYMFFILDQEKAQEIYESMRVKYKMSKYNKEMLSANCGLGVAPVYRYPDESPFSKNKSAK